MTLELTPEQRTDLAAAVGHRLDFIDRLSDDPRMTGPAMSAPRRDFAAEKQRLESLHDLLNVPHTTVTLHQP
jgi:hypothetical protein